MSELEPFFNSAEECAAYEEFCAEQERGLEKFELAEPALVCRWRMARRAVPLLNRHIRALSQRVVNGAPLTTNMLSWAKQHVEWSLAAGEYDDPDGVLMLVIDVNGDALMSVGPYVPLADATRASLVRRAEDARVEGARIGVAPEVLGAVAPDGRVVVAAAPGESLCGAASLVEQLATTRGHSVDYALGEAGDAADSDAGASEIQGFVNRCDDGAVIFLVSDEHGVVVEENAAGEAPAGEVEDVSTVASEAALTAQFLAKGLSKLFS